MDNRTNTHQLREAVEDKLISWIIGLENVTSTLKLVQTVIVLLEWLLPLLEDVRLSANQRDIVAMLRDHLMGLETPQPQPAETPRQEELTPSRIERWSEEQWVQRGAESNMTLQELIEWRRREARPRFQPR